MEPGQAEFAQVHAACERGHLVLWASAMGLFFSKSLGLNVLNLSSLPGSSRGWFFFEAHL